MGSYREAGLTQSPSVAQLETHRQVGLGLRAGLCCPLCQPAQCYGAPGTMGPLSSHRTASHRAGLGREEDPRNTGLSIDWQDSILDVLTTEEPHLG